MMKAGTQNIDEIIGRIELFSRKPDDPIAPDVSTQTKRRLQTQTLYSLQSKLDVVGPEILWPVIAEHRLNFEKGSKGFFLHSEKLSKVAADLAQSARQMAFVAHVMGITKTFDEPTARLFACAEHINGMAAGLNDFLMRWAPKLSQIPRQMV